MKECADQFSTKMFSYIYNCERFARGFIEQQLLISPITFLLQLARGRSRQ